MKIDNFYKETPQLIWYYTDESFVINTPQPIFDIDNIYKRVITRIHASSTATSSITLLFDLIEIMTLRIGSSNSLDIDFYPNYFYVPTNTVLYGRSIGTFSPTIAIQYFLQED